MKYLMKLLICKKKYKKINFNNEIYKKYKEEMNNKEKEKTGDEKK